MGILNFILPAWAKWLAIAMIALGLFLTGYTKGVQNEQTKHKAQQAQYLEDKLIEQAKRIKELNAVIVKDNDARLIADKERSNQKQQLGKLQNELSVLLKQKPVGEIIKEKIVYQECKAEPIVVDKLNEILTK